MQVFQPLAAYLRSVRLTGSPRRTVPKSVLFSPTPGHVHVIAGTTITNYPFDTTSRGSVQQGSINSTGNFKFNDFFQLISVDQ